MLLFSTINDLTVSDCCFLFSCSIRHHSDSFKVSGSHKTLHDELQFWNHLDFSFKGKTLNAKAPVAQVTL